MKKVIGAVLMIGFLVSVPVVSQAQTVAELEQTINKLLAQIAQLQSQAPVRTVVGEPKVLDIKWSTTNVENCTFGALKLPSSGVRSVFINDKTTSFILTCDPTSKTGYVNPISAKLEVTGIRNVQSKNIEKVTIAWSSNNLPACAIFLKNGKTSVNSYGKVTLPISSLIGSQGLACTDAHNSSEGTIKFDLNVYDTNTINNPKSDQPGIKDPIPAGTDGPHEVIKELTVVGKESLSFSWKTSVNTDAQLYAQCSNAVTLWSKEDDKNYVCPTKSWILLASYKNQSNNSISLQTQKGFVRGDWIDFKLETSKDGKSTDKGLIRGYPAGKIDDVRTNEKTSVTILKPNGGEKFNPGDTVRIQWKTVGLEYNPPTQVDVRDDRIPDWTPSSLFGTVPALEYSTLVSSKGNEYVYEHTFTVPETFNDGLPAKYKNIFGGRHYKIWVYAGGQNDTSNKNFTITTKKIKTEDFSSKDIVVGRGKKAETGKVISVNYKGTFADGKIFDSSYSRGTPFEFTLGAGQVIPGWEKGLVGMKVGGKRRLVIPAELAYGVNGVPGAIPPNTTLIFEIELLDVK